MSNKIKKLKKEIIKLKNQKEYLDTCFPKGLREIGLTPDMFWWKNEKPTNHQKEFIRKHGFDYRENFSLFTWIALNVYPRLIEFNKNKMGYPATMTPDEWTEKINKMILAFKIIIEDEYLKSLDTGTDRLTSKGDVKFIDNKDGTHTMDFTDYISFIDRMNTKSDEYKKYQEGRDKLVQEGLNLFAENFLSLWD